jgi:hypothetical protein
MRIKDGFTLRTICGEHIVVGEGLSQVNFNKLISLNPSASYLWEQLLGRDFTEDDMVTLLMDKYDVQPEQALDDVRRLVEVWQAEGLVE